MRLFVAVLPPPDVLEGLADHLVPRQDAGRELRWSDPHQWHVTLSFMADAPAGRLDEVIQRVGEAVAGRPCFEVSLGGAGCFPDPTRARVLWMGVDDPAGGLPGLARAVRSAGNRSGAAPQGGPFQAHVTLARSGRPFEGTRWIRALEGYAGRPWPVREVAVVESHLGEGRRRRPRYEEHRRVRLRA